MGTYDVLTVLLRVVTWWGEGLGASGGSWVQYDEQLWWGCGFSDDPVGDSEKFRGGSNNV
jgi:hypothetical protein